MSINFGGWVGKCKYTGKVNIQNGPHGQGTAVGEDRYRYVGTYKDGSFAKGKVFYPSGALYYEGEYSGGKAHGTGTLFNPDGEVLTGRWEEGYLYDGTVTYPDGRVRKRVNGNWV